MAGNGDTVDIQMLFTNPHGVNGESVGFDNIQVSAVPEPINMGLAAFAVLFGSVCIGRKLSVLMRALRPSRVDSIDPTTHAV